MITSDSRFERHWINFQAETSCFWNDCALKTAATDSMLFPVLQLSPSDSQDPKCLGQTFRHLLPTPKKTSQRETSRRRGLHNLMEGLMVFVIATAIKPLMIWKLVLANTITLDFDWANSPQRSLPKAGAKARPSDNPEKLIKRCTAMTSLHSLSRWLSLWCTEQQTTNR